MTALLDLILAVHLIWIVWVIVGAIWTRGRPAWTAFHIASLAWGILVETGPWPCPLTLAEGWAMSQAGVSGFSGHFVEYYLNSLVYPNLPVGLIVTCAVIVCSLNLAVYVWRFVRWWQARTAERKLTRI